METGVRAIDMHGKHTMSLKQKQLAFEMYRAHFNAMEIAKSFPFTYGTIRSLVREFECAGVERHNRIDLIKKEDVNAEVRKLREAFDS